MARLFSIRPAISFKGRKFQGIRGWAGKPMHPPLTDFPIVAYSFAAAFDVISYVASKGGDKVTSLAHDSFVAATYTMIGGAVLSLGAAITGFWDWWKGIDRDRSRGLLGKAKHTQVWRTINWHATVMLTVTAIVIVDILLRLSQYGDGYPHLLTMVLSVVAGILVSYGAFYGGSLVFDYQFNVQSLEGSTVWDQTERDQLPGGHTTSEP